MVWWWVASAILFLGVIPLIVTLANQVVKLVREVHEYAEDILVHSGEVLHNVEGLAMLERTEALLSSTVPHGARLRELLEMGR